MAVVETAGVGGQNGTKLQVSKWRVNLQMSGCQIQLSPGWVEEAVFIFTD